jgi:hypothetical protein
MNNVFKYPLGFNGYLKAVCDDLLVPIKKQPQRTDTGKQAKTLYQKY